MEHLLVLTIVVLVAAILQTVTGFGFAIIGTPFLLLIFPVPMAIQVNIILSLSLSGVMIFNLHREIDYDLFKKLIIGSLPGLFIGIYGYLYLNMQVIKIGIGVLIIGLTIFLIAKLPIKRSTTKDYLTGGISGLLTTSIGVPGPPLLLYFTGANLAPITLRSTALAYYLLVFSVSLVMQIYFGGTNKMTWLAALSALPALFVGVFLGQLLIKRISQQTFRVTTYLLLVFTGIYLVLSSI